MLRRVVLAYNYSYIVIAYFLVIFFSISNSVPP